MSKKGITKNDMVELVDAYIEYKKAETKFQKIKAKVVSNLEPGIYENDYGKVNKYEVTRNLLDADALAEERPDIVEILETYKKPKIQTSVSITKY